MAQFLKLKDTTQYLQTMAEKDKFKTSSKAVSLKFDITNSIYDEISRIVKEQNVEDIYAKVDMTQAPVPVSFDFKLLRLHVENFRSIEEMTLDFSETNSVTFFSGDNGHGKSSIISALIVGLVGDRLMSRHNRRIDADGNTKPCQIRVDLRYNNKLYFITRGSGFTKFAIDTEDNYQSRASKKELEAFIVSELPFLKYISWFDVRDDKHFFDAIDRTSLIKTCFNLEIFDYLFKFAEKEYNERSNKKSNLESDIQVQTKLIESLQQTIMETQQKVTGSAGSSNRSKEELQGMLQTVDSMYRQVMDTYNELKTKNSIYEMKHDQVDGLQKIDAARVNQYLQMYEQSKKLSDKYNNARTTCNRLDLEARQLSLSLESLIDTTQYCPNCHYVLSKDENYAREKEQLQKKAEEALVSYSQSKSNLDHVRQECESFANQSNGAFMFDASYGLVSTHAIESENTYLQQKLSIEHINESQAEVAKMLEELQVLNRQYNQYATELRAFLGDMKYDEYKSNVTAELLQVTQLDTLRANLEHIHASLREAEDKVADFKKQVIEVEGELKRYAYFKSMFDQSNLDSIPYRIIDTVLQAINSDKIQFMSKKQLASGEDRFKVSCAIKLDNNVFIDYDEASNGQKTVMDLYILNKIISLLNGIGLLVMDESLHNLDASNYTVAKEFFQNTPCHDIIVVAHNPNFDGADREFRCVMRNGITTIEN